MNNKYKKAMDDIKFSEDFAQNAINAVNNRAEEHSAACKTWRFVCAGAAVCACFAMALFAVPALKGKDSAADNTPDRESKTLVSDSFGIVTAYAASPDDHLTALALPCTDLTAQDETAAFPSAANVKLPIINFENGKVSSLAGIDLVVSGDKLSSVTYTSKNNRFFYEDSRNWKDASGSLTWSEYRTFIDRDKLPDAPSKDDIISALEQMQFSENKADRDVIRRFVDRLYSQELADIAAEGGSIDEFLDEKLLEPIDFSEFDIQFSFEDFSDKAKLIDNIKPGWSVTIGNPSNKTTAPIEAGTVTVRPGEYVTWCFNNEAQIIGKERSAFDPEAYSDEITVTAAYKNGQNRTQSWNVSFDKDGYLIITDANQSAAL